ncbi:MAG TPA: D-glycero-beta-D-manno-heptose 1,7-bisphosphate 7-phosphatase [Candidatus Andersenbacteria bacterium]|nr:D-glycero-beta-D-manno-heptose 1,7-bisphosphate 7-phosphatase [Candidatus Andersenbacteria bacterium]
MNKVIFLDRDGTINVDHRYVYKIDDWEFIAQAPAALKKLQQAGYKLAIVTNQSGIGRGYYTLADMQRLHEHMKKALREFGVEIDALAFCPHDPDLHCDCRKPAAGMGKQIEQQLGEIDYVHSWMIGDKERDVTFGQAIGAQTALITSGYWQPEMLTVPPDLIVASLEDFAAQVL